MKVEDAAKLIDMNAQTLRLALQQGLLPFGIAVKTSPNRYTYKIFPKRLEKYLEGVNYEEDFDFGEHSNSLSTMYTYLE